MIKVGDTVRVIAPGPFLGQVCQVLGMSASSQRRGKVWIFSRDGVVKYQLRVTINGCVSVGSFEAHEIEELPQEEGKA